jgi:NADH dehydrogenase FAD-containing subunit
MTHIVILGGGYAGLLATLRLSPLSAQITLVNNRDFFLERIRLHQETAGQTIVKRPLADYLKGTPVNLVVGQVTGLDLAQKKVLVEQAGQTRPLAYDYLVYALGSYTNTNVPGVAQYAYTVENPDTAAQIQQCPAGGQVLVVGGGHTGVEWVTELAEQHPHLRFTLASSHPAGRNLSPAAQKYLAQTFQALQIKSVTGVTIQEVRPGQAITHTGQVLSFDVCLWAGSFAVSDLAHTAGLATNQHQQIWVDGSFRSISHPEVYAIGDAAAFSHAEPLRQSCATAMPQGAYAADHLKHWLTYQQELPPFRFSYSAQCLSLGRGRGLLQLVNGYDEPTRFIVTGRVGKWIKEMICRYTTFSLWLEQKRPGSYLWLKGHAPRIAQSYSSTAQPGLARP